MRYIIENQYLKVEVDTLGAELKSIKNYKNTEYLWQGDATYWRGQATNLFPYIARLTEGKYKFEDQTYEMGIHGFARYAEFTMEEQMKDKLVFSLEENEEILKQYPFVFKFSIIYQLEGQKLWIEYKIENKLDSKMYFGVGGHPGFNVPVVGGAFEDYYLEFSGKCEPMRTSFSKDNLVTGECPYELTDGDKIALTHDLFDQDAIVLNGASSEVSIKKNDGNTVLTVGYPDMKFVGFWHKPCSDAPYVCIEPWSTLPSRDGMIEELDKQPDIVKLDGHGIYSNKWWIEIQ